MGRRGIKEYRAQEALALIAADRDGTDLNCPSCDSAKVERTPPRGAEFGEFGPRRITLECADCSRQAVYTPIPTNPTMGVMADRTVFLGVSSEES